MPALYSHTTRTTGTVLTAAIYNADHQNHIDNGIPTQLDDYSTNLTQMQAISDPGEVGSESLATSLAGEIERLRFSLKEMKSLLNGGSFSQWYGTPPDAVSLLNNTASLSVNAFVESGDTGWKSALKMKSSDAGSHAAEGHFTLHIENRPVGSGANGPAAADYALSLSTIKQNWLTTTTAGELEGLTIVTRQGGDANSDSAGILVNSGVKLNSGFCAPWESVTSRFDAVGAVTHQLNNQIGIVDGANSNFIGYYTKAITATLTDAFRSDTSATASWTNHINCLNNGAAVFSVASDGRTTLSKSLNVKRFDASSEGGQIDLNRASDDTIAWGIDVFGSTADPNLRFFNGSTVPFFLERGTSATQFATFQRDFTGAASGTRIAQLVPTYPSTRGTNQYFGLVGTTADPLVDGSALVALVNDGNADALYVAANGLASGATNPTGIGVDVNRNGAVEKNALHSGWGVQIWNWSTSGTATGQCLLLNNQLGGNQPLGTFLNSGNNRALLVFKAGTTVDQEEGFLFQDRLGADKWYLRKSASNTMEIVDAATATAVATFATNAVTLGKTSVPLKVAAQDGTNEGGELVLNGAGANADIALDNNTGNFRVFQSGTVRFQTDGGAPASGNSAILVSVNDGAVTSLRRVSVGAVDSGGTGFRLLRVPN